MKKSYTLKRWALLIVLTMSVVACSSSLRETEIVNLPNDPVTILSVNVNQSGDSWNVWGELQSITHSTMRNVRIRISVISDDGKVIQQKYAEYRRRISTDRHRRIRPTNKAIFNVTFESIPENARVIAEHVNSQ